MAKESKHVSKFRDLHINSGENIITWGEGYIGDMMGKGDKTQYNGVLIVTNVRVVFYRKGILGEVIETIPLNKITSIERKSLLGHRTIRIHTSHDLLEFKIFDKEKELKLVEAIEAGRKKTDNNTEESTKDINPLVALEKLGELRKAGVITKEEFLKKKKNLLNKI